MPTSPRCPLILEADREMTFGGHWKTEVKAWVFVTVPGILAWLSQQRRWMARHIDQEVTDSSPHRNEGRRKNCTQYTVVFLRQEFY